MLILDFCICTVYCQSCYLPVWFQIICVGSIISCVLILVLLDTFGIGYFLCWSSGLHMNILNVYFGTEFCTPSSNLFVEPMHAGLVFPVEGSICRMCSRNGGLGHLGIELSSLLGLWFANEHLKCL